MFFMGIFITHNLVGINFSVPSSKLSFQYQQNIAKTIAYIAMYKESERIKHANKDN